MSRKVERVFRAELHKAEVGLLEVHDEARDEDRCDPMPGWDVVSAVMLRKGR